jgi:hypothetical protein
VGTAASELAFHDNTSVSSAGSHRHGDTSAAEWHAAATHDPIQDHGVQPAGGALRRGRVLSQFASVSLAGDESTKCPSGFFVGSYFVAMDPEIEPRPELRALNVEKLHPVALVRSALRAVR